VVREPQNRTRGKSEVSRKRLQIFFVPYMKKKRGEGGGKDGTKKRGRKGGDATRQRRPSPSTERTFSPQAESVHVNVRSSTSTLNKLPTRPNHHPSASFDPSSGSRHRIPDLPRNLQYIPQQLFLSFRSLSRLIPSTPPVQSWRFQRPVPNHSREFPSSSATGKIDFMNGQCFVFHSIASLSLARSFQALIGVGALVGGMGEGVLMGRRKEGDRV